MLTFQVNIMLVSETQYIVTLVAFYSFEEISLGIFKV